MICHAETKLWQRWQDMYRPNVSALSMSDARAQSTVPRLDKFDKFDICSGGLSFCVLFRVGKKQLACAIGAVGGDDLLELWTCAAGES